MLLEHLGVAGVAQHPPEPPKLVPQTRGGRLGQHHRERLQGGPQPPGGYPHLVDGIRLVAPDGGVKGLQSACLGADVGRDDLARLGSAIGPGPAVPAAWPVQSGRGPGVHRQRALQLGRAVGPP